MGSSVASAHNACNSNTKPAMEYALIYKTAILVAQYEMLLNTDHCTPLYARTRLFHSQLYHSHPECALAHRQKIMLRHNSVPRAHATDTLEILSLSLKVDTLPVQLFRYMQTGKVLLGRILRIHMLFLS